MHRAIDLGINFFDTAPIYGNGNSESFIGNALVGRRHSVLISTKVGLEKKLSADGKFGVDVVRLNAKNICASVESSLRKLRTDYVDLLQLHAFDALGNFDETMGAIDHLFKEGKICAVGSSNYAPDELLSAIKKISQNELPVMASCQCHYNIIERRAETELIPICREHEIGVICNRALARGVLTGKYQFGKSFPEGSRGTESDRVRNTITKDKLELISVLKEFSLVRGRALPELALAWVLSNPAISTVLIGARDIPQLEASVRAADWDLCADDVRLMDAVISKNYSYKSMYINPEKFLEK